MTSGSRNLLDRLRSLMTVNIAVIDAKTIEDGDILRLIDPRHISESTELIRVLYTSLRGTNAAADDTNQQHLLPTGGQSYWLRQLINAAERLRRRDADALATAYWNLLDILQLTKRTIVEHRHRNHGEKELRCIRRIRMLPEVYREFYGLVDNMLLQI
jgi:hypothetical protein